MKPSINNKSQFAAENRLIRLFSQVDPDRSECFSLFGDKIDWDYIFRTAEEHRIVPILFKQLKAAFKSHIPESICNKFQTRFQEIAAYNFARSTQLIKLINLLQTHNFPVLSYKGMTLAELAYGDVTLRQFTDIDLFVKKKDFSEIKKLLISNDCRSVWTLTAKQEHAVLKYDYEFPFYCSEVNTLVEVHWAFVESFFAFDCDTEKLWKRIGLVTLYGKKIPTLSAVDYLIVLCAHGSKHFWKRLGWICDLDRLVRNTEIDWDSVLKLAVETGSLRMVWLGLYLSTEILKTELPGFINEKIQKDQTAAALGKKFIENLFEADKEPSDWKEMAKIHLKMRENLSTKIKYSERLLTTKLIDKLFMPMGRPR